MADNAIEVQKLYVAYFGRPADPAGLQYWTNLLGTEGMTLDDVARSFAASAEYRDTYANLDNRAVVTAVYENLFGRPAEAAGVDYWSDLLQAGHIKIDDMVTDIAEAARGSDDLVFNGKVAVASLFTSRVDQLNEISAYTGGKANDIATEFIATVREPEDILDALKPDVIDAWIGRITDGHSVATGEVALVGVASATEPLPVF